MCYFKIFYLFLILELIFCKDKTNIFIKKIKNYQNLFFISIISCNFAKKFFNKNYNKILKIYGKKRKNLFTFTS